jgi:3,4-dihydroxy 2-butanone 4-phosphate synthase
VATAFGLLVASDALQFIGNIVEKKGDVPYDRRNHSSFSLWVSHHDTCTGVTDRDRTLTVTSIAKYVDNFECGSAERFLDDFRAPGHMVLLRAVDFLLDQRRGQTELSIALAQMAGVTLAVTICGMVADDDFAPDKEGAKVYAKERGLIFIEGLGVLDEWKRCKATA